MAKLIEATTEGLNDLLRNIDVIKDATLTAHAAALAQVSIDVANYAKQNHSFQNRTGNLENSIQPFPVEVEDDEVVGYVRAGMEYAPPVEFGSSRSSPHPFMHPAVEANKENLRNTMAAAQERVHHAAKVTK